MIEPQPQRSEPRKAPPRGQQQEWTIRRGEGMTRIFCLLNGTKRLLKDRQRVTVVDFERLKKAHNAALTAERKRCDPNEFEKQAQVAVQYYEQQLAAERQHREQALNEVSHLANVRMHLEQQLLSERQRAEQAERQLGMVVDWRDQLAATKQQLLSALAAIEEVRRAGYRLFRQDGTNVLESVDLSLLRDHDAVLTEKVRKPLVEALERMFQVHILHCRICAGPDDGCDEGQRLEQIKIDTLAQWKQPHDY